MVGFFKLVGSVKDRLRETRRGKQEEKEKQRQMLRGSYQTARDPTQILDKLDESDFDESQDAQTLQGIWCGCDVVTHSSLIALALLFSILGVILSSLGQSLLTFLMFCFIIIPMLCVGSCGLHNIRRELGVNVSGIGKMVKDAAVGMHETHVERDKVVDLVSPDLLGSISTKTKSRMNIEVRGLGLTLRSNGATVLAGVDGKIPAGGVTAVMGPSGAGKTTFLNTLAGRASYGITTGQVLINEEPGNILPYSDIVGFVPQVHSLHCSSCLATAHSSFILPYHRKILCTESSLYGKF